MRDSSSVNLTPQSRVNPWCLVFVVFMRLKIHYSLTNTNTEMAATGLATLALGVGGAGIREPGLGETYMRLQQAAD